MGKLCIVRVAQRFDVRPEDMGRYLLKEEGEKVKWSETIARKRAFARTKQIESPVDGVVQRIDSKLGVMIIREVLERPDVPIILDIRGNFKDSAKDLKKCVLTKEGERVEYGQTVAGEQLIPGLPTYRNKVVSPCSGTITSIDYESGRICIQRDLPTTEMEAHYWGKIEKVVPHYGAEIEFGGYVLKGAFGTGDVAWGILVNEKADMKGTVVFLEWLSPKDIDEIIKHQPAGVLAGSIDYEGVERLEKHGITSVIMEGFGRLRIYENNLALLAQSMGRNIILKASTQVRAGVIRPEVIIPSDEEFYVCNKPGVESRIIWGQHYGKKGVIKGKPHYGETSSGIKTWLSYILCDDGEERTPPINNLHGIE
jgi:hypothetical protein